MQVVVLTTSRNSDGMMLLATGEPLYTDGQDYGIPLSKKIFDWFIK